MGPAKGEADVHPASSPPAPGPRAPLSDVVIVHIVLFLVSFFYKFFTLNLMSGGSPLFLIGRSPPPITIPILTRQDIPHYDLMLIDDLVPPPQMLYSPHSSLEIPLLVPRDAFSTPCYVHGFGDVCCPDGVQSGAHKTLGNRPEEGRGRRAGDDVNIAPGL